MNSGCENIYGEVLQSQKDFAYLLLPNRRRLTKARQQHISTADTADSLRRFYFGSLDGLATFKGGQPLFAIPITQILSRMPNRENLTANAQGASTSTANARNSVSKPVQAKPTKRYYQVTIYAKRNDICVANLNCSHPFLAASREEAIGMACDHIKERWPKYMIYADDIMCYPLNLKAL